MRTFVKGDLKTVVEDNDRRIEAYLANGWKEEIAAPSETETPANSGEPNETPEENAANKGLNDATANGSAPQGETADNGKPKRNRGKRSGVNVDDKKVNDAIQANSNAATESNEVDDGLFNKQEGKQ